MDPFSYGSAIFFQFLEERYGAGTIRALWERWLAVEVPLPRLLLGRTEVHLALLAKVDRQSDLEEVVERLNKDWGDLATLRLLGPLAPYDFVVTARPEG